MELNVPSRLAVVQKSEAVQALTGNDAQFTVEEFDPSLKDWSFLRILVIGAGGIGCELLHLLALSGFADITVIDMDIVELSNLNRQFLFQTADIGKPKSVVAAAAVETRCPGVSIHAIFGRIEDQPDSFYKSFCAVFAAVDSVAARRWINRKLAELAVRTVEVRTPHRPSAASDATPSSPGSKNASPSHCCYYVGEEVITDAIPLIDTGTEGFQGHCRRIDISQHRTPCIECEMYLYSNVAQRKEVPMCTLETVPRIPEHCVLYVQLKEWPSQHPRYSHQDSGTACEAEELDLDNPAHIRWVAERARQRQEAFHIVGPPITDAFALGVMKNVVPAVSFTNAYVAGQAVTELMKGLIGSAPELNNYAQYNGDAGGGGGVYACTQRLVGAPDHGNRSVNGQCLVCGSRPVVSIDADIITADALQSYLVELLVPEESPKKHSCDDARLSLLFQPDDHGEAATAEVFLPSRRHEMKAPLTFGESSGTCTVAGALCEAGYAAFVASWRAGNQTAVAEIIGGGDWRLPVILQFHQSHSDSAVSEPH